MKKLLVILSIPFILTACDKVGSSKIKSLVDLTTKLEVESPQKIDLFVEKNPLLSDQSKSYSMSSHHIISEPVVSKGVMYNLNSKGYVTAFSLKEHKILWSFDIAQNNSDRNFTSGGIVVSEGKLYVSNGSRFLVTLDAKTGYELMRKEFPDILPGKAAMVDAKILVVQTISNQLIAYDVETSKFVWVHEGGIETISAQRHINPVVFNGHILASYTSGEVVYLDAKNGEVKWVYNLSKSGDAGLPSFEPEVIVTAPILSEKHTYFATSNGKLVKLDLTNGTPVWVKDVEDVQTMSLYGNNLFVVNNARQVAAISSKDARIYWVGSLRDEQESKARKPKTALFQKPFINKMGDKFAVNVIASNGNWYYFVADEKGYLPAVPQIKKVKKDIKYSWISCCTAAIHLIDTRKVQY